MAATKTLLAQGTLASRLKVASYSVAGDAEYPAGGYSISFSTDFSTVYDVQVNFEVDHGTVRAKYDRTNGKLYLSDVAEAGAQVTTSTDVSNLTFYLTVTGVK